MPEELTQELIQTTLQLPTQKRKQLVQLLLDSLESEQEQETSEVPRAFFDPATGETYGIEGLRAKLAESEAAVEAGDYVEIQSAQELKSFFDTVKQQGRERLASKKS